MTKPFSATEDKAGSDVKFLCLNTLVSFLMTGVLLCIAAFVAVYFAFSDRAAELAVMLITAFCVFYGGYRAAGHTGKQGLLQGIVSAAVYILIVYLAGCIILGEWSFHMTTVSSFLIAVASGAIGGVLGVNRRKDKRKKREQRRKTR